MLTSSMQTVRAMFHGNEYAISWSVEDNVLEIDIEDTTSLDRWTEIFQAKYIEDITHKTGSFKRFDVFVNMFSKALKQGNDHLFVELLTLQDLEMLKNRRSANKSNSYIANQSLRGNQKRYLILTYVAEFDRVHYPLPLPHCENPSKQQLHLTISRLRKELKYSKHDTTLLDKTNLPIDSDEMVSIKQENSHLKKQLAKALSTAESLKQKTEKNAASNNSVSKLKYKLTQVEDERDSLLEEIKAEREESQAQFKAMKAKIKQLAEQQQSSPNTNSIDQENERIAELEEELINCRAYHRKETARLKEDLRQLEDINQQLNRKLRSQTQSTSRPATTPSRGRPRSTSRDQRPRFDPTEYQRAKEKKLSEILNRKKNRSFTASPKRTTAKRPTPSRRRDSPMHAPPRHSAPVANKSRRARLNSSGSRQSVIDRLSRPSPRYQRKKHTQEDSGYMSSASQQSYRSNRSQGSRTSKGSVSRTTKRRKPKTKPSPGGRSTASARSGGNSRAVKRSSKLYSGSDSETDQMDLPRIERRGDMITLSRQSALEPEGDENRHTLGTDNSLEIESIDQRLMALQSFLKSAKVNK